MTLQWTCIKAAGSEAEQMQAFQRHWSLKEVQMQLTFLQRYKPYACRLICMDTNARHVVMQASDNLVTRHVERTIPFRVQQYLTTVKH